MSSITVEEVKYVKKVFDTQKPCFGICPPQKLKLVGITPVKLPQEIISRFKKGENTQILFHGTPLENHEKILSEGFKMCPGMLGHIGKGIYFSDLIEQSLYYQLKYNYTGKETYFKVIVCKVVLGNCTERKRDENWENLPFSSDTHWTLHEHERFYKILHKEYCVNDMSRILPIAILKMKVE